jgi:small-conductance mechanosensitive channel
MATHPLLHAATGSIGTPPAGRADGSALESLSAAWTPEDLTGALGTAGLLVGVAVVAVLVHALAFFLAGRAARRTPFQGDEVLVTNLRGPLRIVIAVLAVQFTMPSVPMADAVRLPLRHALSLTLIIAVTWLAIQLIRAGTQVVISRFDTAIEDNLEARKVHTQLRVLSRMFGMVAGVIGVGVALMTFPTIRQLGASILASAGIAGLIVGLAAQKVIANFLAGLQIVFAGPIHLDDVVVIDGEWGRIEEITTTYVVVRIWDERRLIVPFSRFLDEPFANWTRSRSEVLGTVYLHADYTVPVDALREELQRVVEASPHWDKRAWGLVVTDATRDTVELRALMSARNGSKAWDLRCEVREKLIGFLQREHSHCLPRTRVTLEERGGDGASEAAATLAPGG